MTVINVKSNAEFDAAVRAASTVAVHFWAPWCEPCTHMDAVFSQLAAENPQEKFLRVEAEEFPEITEQYDVSAVPFFVFFKNGAVVDTLEGANPPDLASKVTRHVAAAAASSAPRPAPSTTGSAAAPAVLEHVLASAKAATSHGEAAAALTPGVRSRLEGLVRSRPVVLFMKGVPEAPGCGFSGRVVAALRELGVPFGSVDVLADEEVRRGMKELSHWPTFPQLYCRGELVGGCDIVLEMHESGELKRFLEEEGVLAGSAEGPTLEERLRALVASQKTMLFMKGTPDEPRCGFSRRVVNALRQEGHEFGSFDILSDEEVRQGMKEFSNWPTFPQLYHNGELVGGCDIVMEMHESGELRDALAS